MTKANAYLIGAAIISFSLIGSQGCTKSTEADDELVGNWKRADDFEGNARSEAVSFTIGDYAYVSTGSTNSDRFKDLWEYNLSRRYWIQKADLPGVARNSAVAFSIGTKGYVGTGYDGATRLTDFWEYDQATNQWTQKANFTGSGRYDAVGFALNDKGYISCGYDGNYLKDLWQYDPATDQWLQKQVLADPNVRRQRLLWLTTKLISVRAVIMVKCNKTCGCMTLLRMNGPKRKKFITIQLKHMTMIMERYQGKTVLPSPPAVMSTWHRVKIVLLPLLPGSMTLLMTTGHQRQLLKALAEAGPLDFRWVAGGLYLQDAAAR
jgi:hypothetical protein